MRSTIWKMTLKGLVKKLTNGQGVDVVQEMVGGDVFKKSVRRVEAFGSDNCNGLCQYGPKEVESIIMV